MELNHPAGIAAVVLGVISFYGMTYVVIALNTGWRFGYWIAGASLGVLMFLMSIFWIVTALGPRGAEPKWTPLASGSTRISQASLKETRLASVSQYPNGPWRPAEEGSDLEEQSSEFESSVTNCLTTDPSKLPAEDRKTCEQAQALMPDKKDIPVLEGAAAAMTPELEDVRFTEDNGALLAQGRVVPLTRDPRVAKDPEKGAALGDPFLMLAVRDEGSLRVPAYASAVIFGVFAVFHLLGLHRAEQRKLSPVA